MLSLYIFNSELVNSYAEIYNILSFLCQVLVVMKSSLVSTNKIAKKRPELSTSEKYQMYPFKSASYITREQGIIIDI